LGPPPGALSEPRNALTPGGSDFGTFLLISSEHPVSAEATTAAANETIRRFKRFSNKQRHLTQANYLPLETQ
jgi:hypothetical protein